MKFIVTEDYEAMSRTAARVISGYVSSHPDCVLGLATGSTPIGLYRCLVEDYEAGALSFKDVTSFNLDEYRGLDPQHDQSYRYFMEHNLFSHVDIDPAEIGKNRLPQIPVVGDAKVVLAGMQELIEQDGDFEPITAEWMAQINEWRDNHPFYSPGVATENGTISPEGALDLLSDMLDQNNSIVTTEVGQHQMWAAQHIARDIPRTFLSSGGLGTMGFGFPAAIGAKVACPEKEVVCIAGDGSYQMNIQEMTTASYYGINVKVLIMNNSVLGMVHQWQNLFYDERYSETILPDLPDFVKVAEAYNWQAERVEKPEDLEGALKRLIEADRPALLDMRIDSDENVFPMVPAGAPLTEMFGYIKVGPNGELIDERKEEK